MGLGLLEFRRLVKTVLNGGCIGFIALQRGDDLLSRSAQ